MMAPYRGYFSRKATPSIILTFVVSGFALMILISILSGPNHSRILEMKRRNIYNGDYETHTPLPNGQEQILFDGPRFIEQPDLVYRVNDLEKVKLSLNNELRIIARKRSKILKDVTALQNKNENMMVQISKNKALLRQLEIDLAANKKRKMEESCDNARLTPIVFNPMKSYDIEQFSIDSRTKVPSYDVVIHNSVSYTFDYSRCSLVEGFKFELTTLYMNSSKSDQFTRSLISHEYHGVKSRKTCVSIFLIGETGDLSSLNQFLKPERNNILLFINANSLELAHRVGLLKKSAFISYEVGSNIPFRNKFDLIIPSVMVSADDYNTIMGSRPIMMPSTRKYVASYFGSIGLSSSDPRIAKLESILQTIHQNSYDDIFLFLYDCGLETGHKCYAQRDKLIELSNFLVILPPENGTVMNKYTNDLIYLSLSRNTIPVIIGKDQVRLPFDEVLDWRQASIILPVTRLPELHYILRTYSASDIYKLKYHGKKIFENHMATMQQIVDTMISLMSVERFQIPPEPVKSIRTQLHNHNHSNDISASILDWTKDIESLEVSQMNANSTIATEVLGPHEIPLKSKNYLRNMSLILNSAFEVWNNPMYSPFKLYPSLPNDPIAPSEYKFLSADQSYRPIANGAGGSGSEFSHSLGGDMPNEQFTVVLLTYERLENLIKTLERLKGMPYVNKYLIVWNSVNRPPSVAAASMNLNWPPTNMGAPLKVLKVDRNSLNNRFLPFDEIETDAIFSLDDDSPLRQDEIVFAFRVWRESRDRLVGFPGRFHAWNLEHQSWIYNSNHSCELSMVLTGGAFFHRYYLYAYTYDMPSTIRKIVDNLMNCEDIAMNFLVAHLTRKAPIKVTSRWTFTCQDCPSSLSDDPTHFHERHECLNIFASIYGYMPLLSTQHRSDSVLFKTRLPVDKQKCFKFV